MLEDLKLLLGFSAEDKEQDAKLERIISLTTARLTNLLGGIEPPEELQYIVLEVSVIRFNRIGSEGYSAHSVEGENITFPDSDFAGFMGDIQTYLDSQNVTARGKVRFL